MPRFRCVRFAVVLAGVLGALLVTGRAGAFERQWHFGAGGGFATPGGGYKLGPAVGLHAAYGLSDVFDARLEVLLSRHRPVAPKDPAAPRAPLGQFYGAKLGIAYKLDVIQWIPYFGVSAGFLGMVDEWEPYRGAQATLGLMAGLDYALTRSVGLGVVVTVDYPLGPPAVMTAGLLRAEYRFGW
jgi:hypothetical protein